MIDLEETAEGILLPVRAQPGARKNGVTGAHDGRLKVAVTQAAEKGKANQALQKVIAAELRIKKSQVQLTSGPTAAHKRFLVTGTTLEELHKRIEVLLQEQSK